MQSWPLEQPTDFQYQAHGLHRPFPCSLDPFEAMVLVPRLRFAVGVGVAAALLS